MKYIILKSLLTMYHFLKTLQKQHERDQIDQQTGKQEEPVALSLRGQPEDFQGPEGRQKTGQELPVAWQEEGNYGNEQ